MIEFLKDWTVGIVTALLLMVLLEILMPSGSMKKFVNLVAGLVLVICIISPIAKVLGKEFRLEESFYIDSSFLDRMEISKRGKELEEEQRDRALNSYRERLIDRIEQSVNDIEGIAAVSADIIINEDYESVDYGKVIRIYLEISTKEEGENQGIGVGKVVIEDTPPPKSNEKGEELAVRAREKAARITDTAEDDVVVSLR